MTFKLIVVSAVILSGAKDPDAFNITKTARTFLRTITGYDTLTSE